MSERIYRTKRNYVELGQYLREMRLKAGLSQREVSNFLGYSSAQFISNFENGIAQPPLEKLSKLIHLFNMPLETLMQVMLKEQEKIIRTALEQKARVRRKAS